MPKSKAKNTQPRRANPNRSRARPTPDAPRRSLPQAARGVADSLLHARAPETPPWKYLPLILALAFAARAAVALHGDFTLHPDEIMQYLEPAHNLVFGNGVLHWEFFYGARAWLLPGLVAGVLALFDLVGLGETLWYIEAVKLLFCAISLLIPAGMYFFARRHFSETAARVALLAGAFWYELVGFAHKPMSEFNATALLLVLLALCVRPPSARLIWPLAAVAVLAAALRLQYAPIALLLLGMAFIRSHHKLHLLLASALLLLALGVFDAVTWDAVLFHSYLTNIRYNLSFPFFAGGDGEISPFYKYVWWLTLATAALAPLCIAASLAAGGWRRYGLLLALIAIVLLLHSVQAYQEYRFIFLTTPLWLLIGADLLARAVARVNNPRPLAGAAALFVALSGGGLLNVLPGHEQIWKSAFSPTKSAPFIRNQPPIFAAYRWLARTPEVSAVWEMTHSYSSTPGYSLAKAFGDTRILQRDRAQPATRKWQSYSVISDQTGDALDTFRKIGLGKRTPPPDFGIRFLEPEAVGGGENRENEQ